MADYIIRAARDEDTNEGWVWMAHYPSRTIVKLTANPGAAWQIWKPRTVYCQARKIDPNFIKSYNKRELTIKIPLENGEPTIVMSAWYRDALGGLHAVRNDNSTTKTAVKDRPCCVPVWRSLRAACHHPEISVRLGTRLGVLGVWLGVVGLTPTAVQLFGARPANTIFAAIAVAGAIVGLIVCRGPRRPLRL